MRVLAATLLCLTSLAHAEPPGLTPVTSPTVTPEVAPAQPKPLGSYRGQLLLADGLAVGLLVVAADTDDNDTQEALAKLGIGTYVFGAPLIHLTKNKSSRAIASVAMRIGFPIVGGMLGSKMSGGYDCSGDVCYDNSGEEIAIGIVVGAIAASALDAYYLGKGDPPPADAAQPGWAPTVRASARGGSIGVMARF